MNRTLIHADYGGGDPFGIFDQWKTATVASQIYQKDTGCLLLHGGTDICPQIYGQKAIDKCQVGDNLSPRDLKEISLIVKAWKIGMPIIGICRGAQLLCALDGGSLVQHIENHVGRQHTIVDTETGEVYKANSAHHQMMVLNKNTGAKILAQDTTPTKGLDEEENELHIDIVPEIVHFPQLRAIGIQGHPEWMANSAFTKYCAQLIKRYIL